MSGFAHILACKSPKTQFFAQKYLIRYTHKRFCERYVNFQNHYLSHCGVVPVQSFRSHIRPQPHGLGLIPLIFPQFLEHFIPTCYYCSLLFHIWISLISFNIPLHPPSYPTRSSVNYHLKFLLS